MGDTSSVQVHHQHLRDITSYTPSGHFAILGKMLAPFPLNPWDTSIVTLLRSPVLPDPADETQLSHTEYSIRLVGRLQIMGFYELLYL